MQYFDDQPNFFMFEYAYLSYLQSIKPVCKRKLKIIKILLYSWVYNKIYGRGDWKHTDNCIPYNSTKPEGGGGGYVYINIYTFLSETDSHMRLGSYQLSLCKFKNWKSEFLSIPIRFEKMYFLNRVDVLDTCVTCCGHPTKGWSCSLWLNMHDHERDSTVSLENLAH